MRRFAVLSACFFVAWTGFAADPEPEAGPNLTLNSGFTSSLANWTAYNLAAQWSSADAQGSASSGSALLRNSDSDASKSGELVQCIGIQPNRSFQFDLMYMVPTGQARTGAVYFLYSTGSSCFGADSSRDIPSYATAAIADGAWHAVTTGGSSGPSDTVLRLSVRAGKFEPGGEIHVNVDRIFVVELQPVVYVFGPSSAPVVEPVVFLAAANACNPTGVDWNWSATGNPLAQGGSTYRQVFTWASPGTYTVTVTNGSCIGTSASKSVSIAAVAPKIVVTATPRGMAQGEVTTDSFSLANLGGSSTTVSLALQAGTYFSINPSSFTLAAGATQTVSVSSRVGKTAKEEPAPSAVNSATDIVNVSGVGVPAGTKIVLSMMLSGPSSAGASVRPDSTRVDVAADPATTGPSGGVTFTNTGNATMLAAVVPTTSWINPGQTTVEIPPGGSKTISFVIDRARRPDGQAPLGSKFGDLLLLFRRFGLAGKEPFADPGIAGVTVVDTAKPAAAAAGIPALAPGEYALFVPGVGHKRGSVGLFISDLTLLNYGGYLPIDGLRMYYLAIGGTSAAAQQSAALSLATQYPISVADTVNSTFGNGDSIGTIQLRSSQSYQLWSAMSVGATVFNVSNQSGTYGTALPVFRSDRSARPGGVFCLTGLRKDANAHTNLYLLETAGKGATVNVDFLSPVGTVLSSRSETLAPFALAQWSDTVPAGAVSALVTNTSGSPGQVAAFATPVDRSSGDTWAVADWAAYFGYAVSSSTKIPIVGSVHGANQTWFRSDVSLMNVDTTPVTIKLRYYPRGAAMVEKSLQLAARETRVLSDVAGGFFAVAGDSVGSVAVVPPSPSNVRVTSRTYTTVAGQTATYGTGVPTMALGNETGPGEVRRLGGIEDASIATINSARPGTFRANFGIVETQGATARVIVRLRYDGVSGDSSLVASRGVATREFSLAPREFVLLSNVAREILGPAARDSRFGDMRNLDVEFQVVEGRVIGFVTTTDNGTGDTVFRIE